MQLRTRSWHGLLLVLASPGVALAQSGVHEIAALGEDGRRLWPALGAAVDEAEALRRAADAPYDAQRLFRARYGQHVSARRSREDCELLAEALSLLAILERRAERLGTSSAGYRATQDQLLARLNEGFRVAARAAEAPSARAPQLESVHEQPVSYEDQLRDLRIAPELRAGTAPATLLLISSLAGAQGTPAGDALLGDERLLQTLAEAEHGQLYALEGQSERWGRYRGTALLVAHGAGSQLVRRVAGRETTVGALSRRGAAWRSAASLQHSPGVAGALAAAPAQAVRFEAEHRAGASEGELEGRWTLRAEDGAPLDRGTEVLRRVGPDAGLEARLRQSELMAAIVAAVAPQAAAGNVPADLLLSTRNVPAARPLLTGPEIFGAMAERILEAEEEVLLQFFVWEADSEAAARIVDALRARGLRRAEEAPDAPPIRVRFVVNYHPIPRVNGGGAAWSAIQEQFGALDRLPGLDVRVARKKHLLLGNLHTKALVVDGWRVMVTGANAERVHDAGQPWFDAGFAVDGEVGRSMRAEFDEVWHQVTGEHLPALRGSAPALTGRAPVLIAGRRAVGSPFADGVRDPQGAAFVAAIRNAQQRIRIQTPNLNDDDIKRALLHALLVRGVRVEVVLPYRFNEAAQRVPGRGGPNLDNVRELYQALEASGDAGARERLDVRWYTDAAGELVIGNGPGASHCKYATFDGQVAIVGSGNLDRTAITNSRELNLVVDDRATVEAWDARLFEPNFRRAVREHPSIPLLRTVDVTLGD